uniref:hypothetical protein n=1 Tax=Clostridium perfringens TaxID=1502 RepID=UPI00396B39E1
MKLILSSIATLTLPLIFFITNIVKLILENHNGEVYLFDGFITNIVKLIRLWMNLAFFRIEDFITNIVKLIP